MCADSSEHHLFHNLSDAQKAEAQRFLQDWEQGTFDCVEDSIDYHYKKHASGSLLDYLYQASHFRTKGARRSYLAPDRVRYIRSDGEYLLVNPLTGNIISYGRNQ